MQRKELRWRCVALKTSPTPPAPSTLRISYLPSSSIPGPMLSVDMTRVYSEGLAFTLSEGGWLGGSEGSNRDAWSLAVRLVLWGPGLTRRREDANEDAKGC